MLLKKFNLFKDVKQGYMDALYRQCVLAIFAPKYEFQNKPGNY